jgi:hypothetical protein
MQQPFKTAREVCEYMLMRTGRAMKAGDFDAFRSCFTLPQVIETFEGSRIINDTAQLKTVFDAVRTHYIKNGVTEIVRHCVEAEFVGVDRVLATHETRLVSGNVITQKPFPVMSVLKFDGTDWYIASSSYAIEDRSDHNAALMSAGEIGQIRSSPQR